MAVGSEGQVVNPTTVNLPDGGGATIPPTQGKQGEYLVSEIHGKYFVAAQRKGVFTANVTAVTVPAIAATLVSVFTLWNPIGSGIIGEMIRTDVGVVLSTIVVDTIGWYASFAKSASTGTFTTPGVGLTNIFSTRTGEVPANQIQFYSAYTHVGTPVRVDIIGCFGAAALTTPGPVKLHDGTMLVMPGTAVSVAMSTTVATTSGTDLQATWGEWPFV